MADRQKPKSSNQIQRNPDRRNGKAPKKHPKSPVKKRTDEQLAQAEEQRKIKRAKAREEYFANLEREKARILADQKKAEEEREKRKGRKAQKSRQSEAQKRRAAEQQAAAKIAAATIHERQDA